MQSRITEMQCHKISTHSQSKGKRRHMSLPFSRVSNSMQMAELPFLMPTSELPYQGDPFRIQTDGNHGNQKNAGPIAS